MARLEPPRWWVSPEERLQNDIHAIMTRKPLELPRAAQFVPQALAQMPRRPTTVAIFGEYGPGLGVVVPLSPARPTTQSSHRPRLGGHLSELTLTYVNVLQRAEDFNRRAVIKDEKRNRGKYEKVRLEFEAMIPLMLAELRAVWTEESSGRAAIEKENREVFLRARALEAASLALTRRREGSRPQCPLLAKGKASHITEEATERCFVELSWRGGVDLFLCAVLLDNKGAVFGVATGGEGIRAKGRTLLIRPLNDYDGNCGNGIGGSRMTLQVNLTSCPITVTRIAFCVCPRGSADAAQPALRDVKQCWMTMSDLDPRTDQPRQLMTVFVSPPAPSPCVLAESLLVASLRRRGDQLWQFVNDSTILSGVRKPQALGNLLATDSAHGHAARMEEEVELCVAALVQRELENRETLLRLSHVMQQEEIERRALLVQSDPDTLTKVVSRRELRKLRQGSM